jgi:DNA-binding YbaB/EbfC family protein
MPERGRQGAKKEFPMQDMSDLLRQAQEMQAKMNKIQEGLAKRVIKASSGGGMVTVLCNGKQEVLRVSIEPAAVDPGDVQMLEDLVLTAVNESLRLSREVAAQEMGALTGGLRIPGL